MTETPELGDLIRESRLALGYSLGQLATKVGRTAATVRTWERGEAIPNEESRGALVKVLGIDPSELEGLVPTADTDADAGATAEGDGDAADSTEEPVAVTLEPDDGSESEEESVAAGASDESDSVTGENESDLDAAAGVAVAAALVGAADAELILPSNDEAESVQGEDDEDGEEPQGDDADPGEGADDEDEPTEPADDEADESDAADDGDTDESDAADGPDSDDAEGDDVEDEGDAAADDVAEDDDAVDGVADDDAEDTDDTLEGIAAVTPFEVDPALIDEPTEAVVVPVVATATGVATQTRSVVTVSEPKERTSRNPLRILFDPSKRWLYWIRALFTLVVAGALVVVLAWAAGEFFDALGQVLDSIEPTEVDDGGIDALGRLRTLI